MTQRDEVRQADTAPGQLPLPIDRRPVRTINCWNGDPNDPAGLGLSPGWRTNDWAMWLRANLDHGVNIGFRRFMLILPAGHPQGQWLMSSSQWLTMPEERRRRLPNLLTGWKERNPGVQIGVYAGFPRSDPASLRMVGRPRTPSIGRDWAWFQANWRPWIEDCRIDFVTFDYAGTPNSRASLVAVARAFAIAGVKVIGEAIPTVRTADGLALAHEVNLAPWFELDWLSRIRDPLGRRKFNPATTECWVGFKEWTKVNGVRVLTTEEQVRSLVAQGLVPLTYDSKWEELVIELSAAATEPAGDTGGEA